MRAYVVNEWKHPSQLALVHNAPEPAIGPEDVLVDVYSATLNFFDVRVLHDMHIMETDHLLCRYYKPRANTR